MTRKYNISKESNGGTIGFPELIDLYYTALMTFLVFTAANNLIRGVLDVFHWRLILYMLLWLSMVIQTTFAYKHIKEIRPKNYNVYAFISDSIDICIFIFVCAAIGGTYNSAKGEFIDMTNYRRISIPFLILSVNQFCWYVVVQERNMKAVFRLVLLFIVMLTATILDVWFHYTWLLAGIVFGNIVIMVGLRIWNKAPISFENRLNDWWTELKKTSTIKRLLEKLSKINQAKSVEQLSIAIESDSKN